MLTTYYLISGLFAYSFQTQQLSVISICSGSRRSVMLFVWWVKTLRYERVSMCFRSSSSCCLGTRASWWSSWWARARGGSRTRRTKTGTNVRSRTMRPRPSAASSSPWCRKWRTWSCLRGRRRWLRSERLKQLGGNPEWLMNVGSAVGQRNVILCDWLMVVHV